MCYFSYLHPCLFDLNLVFWKAIQFRNILDYNVEFPVRFDQHLNDHESNLY
jgi:hypothetical protein